MYLPKRIILQLVEIQKTSMHGQDPTDGFILLCLPTQQHTMETLSVLIKHKEPKDLLYSLKETYNFTIMEM